MTRAAYYITRIQAAVIHRRDDILAAYNLSPDDTRFWAFIDLAKSANYRLTKGAKEGYVRGEEFYTLVYSAIAPYAAIQPLKELGDGVLLSSSEVRPMFEACALIAQAAEELAEVAGSESFPFAVRIAIGYGPCKQLRDRLTSDFLGTPIDVVARLNGAASPGEILVTEDAYGPNRQVFDEYEGFVSFGRIEQLSAAESKSMVQPVSFRRASIDRAKMNAHEGNFVPWHELTESSSGPRA